MEVQFFPKLDKFCNKFFPVDHCDMYFLVRLILFFDAGQKITSRKSHIQYKQLQCNHVNFGLEDRRRKEAKKSLA